MLAQQRTSIRERRSLRSYDGSQLGLNADTALDIRFDSKQRLIQVYRGEMLVNTALGTRFRVRQLTEQTRVGVLQAARISMLNALCASMLERKTPLAAMKSM